MKFLNLDGVAYLWGKIKSTFYTKGEVNTLLNDKAAKNHAHSDATTTQSGFMSGSDKAKLEGIAAGATKVVVDEYFSTISKNPVQNDLITNRFNVLEEGVYSKEETNAAIAAAVQNANHLKYEIVAQLPGEGAANVIYLVQDANSNAYTEYMWINDVFEKIGDTEIAMVKIENAEIDSVCK